MCGIAGIFAYHYAANPVDRAELARMRAHMAARGPDGEGDWAAEDGRVALAHRRLAILDLSARAAQPMASADGRLVITYNGEIYNYRSLRRSLEARGRTFRTESDTEVLLELYAEKGPAMVDELRGMFAFGLWDATRRGLFLARDGYGIKPLYYADNGWTLRFASQVKALLAGGAVSRDPEPAGWAGFLLFGHVPEPFTTYREIRALPAGSTAWVEARGLEAPKRFFALAGALARAEAETPAATTAPAELRERVRAAVADSVRHHLVADVPVGIFLSAGVDSGALLGVMRDVTEQPLHAITLTFESYRGTSQDEVPLAAAAARRYGAEHSVRVVPEAEFRADLPRILDAMDQPTIDGINSWFVSKAAREFGLKAVISGIGGDELFAGYPSFRDIPRWVKWGAVPARVPFLGDAFRILLSAARALPVHPKTAGLVKYAGSFAGAYLLRRGIFMPWELGTLLDPETMADGLRRLDPVRRIAASLVPGPRGAVAKVAALEGSLYLRDQLLRDCDWASMAHSVEVRVPLVDTVLLESLAPALIGLAPGSGKQLLAACPRTPLPRETVERAKTGFETPIAEWLRRDARLQLWSRVPQLKAPACPWARRYAYQLAAA